MKKSTRFCLGGIVAFLLALAQMSQGNAQNAAVIEITPDVAEIDLGSTSVGSYSSPKNITFKVSPIDWDYDVSFVGTDVADFHLAKRPFFDFGTGEAEASVMFAPKSSGKKEAYFVLKHINTELRRIKVVGLGVGASGPEIQTDYSVLEFGEVEVGQKKSIRLSVSTANSGSSIATSIRGTHASEFQITGSVMPNQKDQSLEILFTPQSEGEKSAELVLKDGELEKLVTIKASGKTPGASIVITPDVREVDLGTTIVGQYSSPQSITFKVNPIDFEYNFSFEGDQAGDFYQYKRPYFDYGTGEATATFMFAPKSVGPKKAYLILKYGTEEKVRITIKGEGIAASSPEIITDLSALEFGNVLIGSQKELSLSVTTKNSSSYYISSEIEGENAAEFQVEGTLNRNTENQILKITFKPTSEGYKNASLVIKDGEVIKKVSISASAQKPEAKITPSVEKLQFPDTYLGETSSSQTISFTFANLTENISIAIEGTHAKDFSYQGSLDVHAAQGSLTLSYQPQTAGKSEAVLKISSTGTTCAVPLVGMAYEKKAPEIVANPQSFDFGDVQINTYVTKEIAIEIRHTSALPQLQLSGTDKEIFNIISSPQSGAFTLKVGALPNKKGSLQAAVEIQVEAVSLSIPITLNCWAPEIVLQADPEKLEFAKTPIMSHSVEKGINVRLKNLSEDVTVSITGENASEFQSSKTTLSRESESGYVGVTFCPTTLGNKKATLILSAEGKTVEIALEGEADYGIGVQRIDERNPLQAVPNHNTLHVWVSQPGELITIVSPTGVVVYSQRMDRNELAIPLNYGTYIVRYQNHSVKTIIE